MKHNYHLKTISFLALSGALVLFLQLFSQYHEYHNNEYAKQSWHGEQEEFDSPEKFQEYFNAIAKPIGATSDAYEPNHALKALNKARQNHLMARSTTTATWQSRGPDNVAGRTRALIVDPDDATFQTFYAGSASGGIWKTTDAGLSWTDLTPNLPNLSTNALAMAPSNHDRIYAGTGEGYAGNYSFVRGNGIFISNDRGGTWTVLNNTLNNKDFKAVNELAVSPSDENVILAATNTGVLKSNDGGATWSKTFDSQGYEVQDIKTEPGNFAIQYIGVKNQGVYKSTDGGATWSKSSVGINKGSRFEIAISPVTTSNVFVSTSDGDTGSTILYFSDDKGATWNKFDSSSAYDYLGGQGWYDNAILADPFSDNIAYVGGVNIGKFTVDKSTITTTKGFKGLDNGTNFISLVNFSAAYNGGTLEIGTSNNPVNVEIRFGNGLSQKAHRFTVPADGGTNGDGGAGVPASSYTYQDYVDVPFQVWDVDHNRQLMVSFRDQQADGKFNLNPRDDTNDPNLLTAREYIYIHDVPYAATPDPNIATAGGQEYNKMYYFWPILANGATWDPANLPASTFNIYYGDISQISGTTNAIYDAYGNFNSANQNNLHPDQHVMLAYNIRNATQKFSMLIGNDGGIGKSDNSGNTFTQLTNGYITTQFYGADKMPGSNIYIGGAQDNGTWVSKGEDSTTFNSALGGDGFEVVWKADEPQKVLGSIYNNKIYKSINGGSSWSSASSGITDSDGPFITRLASSIIAPNIVYAIGGAGVYKSTNFAGSWSMKTISGNWGGASSQHDVEVSLANDSIVWAGGGMSQGVIDMFVSTDQGETYNPVQIPSPDPKAYISGLATHPTLDSTAFLLFSVAKQAKILRTDDLGQTWKDISGFNGNSTSSTGFPDVFVHSFLVLPSDTATWWAGTEIGIFETNNSGQSWHLITDLPSVSVWSMKVVDDQVVIGTHGRGIWTASIADLAKSQTVINGFKYLGYQQADLKTNFKYPYDSVQVMLNGNLYTTIKSFTAKKDTLLRLNILNEGAKGVQLLSYVGADVYPSNTFISDTIHFAPRITNTYYERTDGLASNLVAVGAINEYYDSLHFYVNGTLIKSDVGVTDSATDIQRTYKYQTEITDDYNVKLAGYIDGNEYASTSQMVSVIAANKQNQSKPLVIYPNPAHDMVKVQLPADVQRANYQIVNIAGKVLQSGQLTQQDAQVDITPLKEGLYVLKLDGTAIKYYGRIIKR